MNKNKDIKVREKCHKIWCQLLDAIDRENKLNEDTVEEQNQLVCELESNLPFKDHQEHEHWLGVLQGFKFWEDFEELTLSIIERKGE